MGIQREIADLAELQRLADRVMTDRRFCVDEHHKALAVGVLALITENERLGRFEKAHSVWLEKTEWVQESVKALELGQHRADVLRSRIDQLCAESAALLDGMTRIMRATRLGDAAFAIACEVVGELVIAETKGEQS